MSWYPKPRVSRSNREGWKVCSSFQRQWYDIFKHEFIMSIWLPEKGFDTFLYKPSKDVYIPSRVFDNSNLLLWFRKVDTADENCYFSSDQLYKAIQDCFGRKSSCYTSSGASKPPATLMVCEISSYFSKKSKTPLSR